MRRETEDRAVVETVQFGRALAIACSALAVVTFAVVIIVVRDRVEVFIGSVLVGLIWGVGMSAIFSGTSRNDSPLMRIPADALPPEASLPMALITSVALFAILEVFLVASLYALPPASAGSTTLGMMLGVPIAQWVGVVRARRTECELGGTLWMTPNIAWRSQSRDRYLALPD